MEIKIRPLKVQDAETSYKWRNIPEIWEHTGSKPDRKISLEDETQWINKVIADPSSRRFAILADGFYVGNVYLTDISNGRAEYHIFIGEKDYWGKGIAREASRLIVEFGKTSLKLKEIYLKVKEKNTGALHLYQTLGFKEVDKNNESIVMSLKLKS